MQAICSLTSVLSSGNQCCKKKPTYRDQRNGKVGEPVKDNGKPTHTDQYLSYDSHHPQSVKRGVVKCRDTIDRKISPLNHRLSLRKEAFILCPSVSLTDTPIRL